MSFNSPWECRIGLTSPRLLFRGRGVNSFNSPWECRIGLTDSAEIKNKRRQNFQFPVGMSNRSYLFDPEFDKLGASNVFQFPVGMSNRSY